LVAASLNAAPHETFLANAGEDGRTLHPAHPCRPTPRASRLATHHERCAHMGPDAFGVLSESEPDSEAPSGAGEPGEEAGVVV
jgi:hypothetical protein